MKRTCLISNIILSILIVIGDIFYMIYNDFVWLKALTSLGFVALGIINFICLLKFAPNDRKFGVYMLVGLVFAFAGDVMLEFIFALGAGLFAIGHVFYFIAYCNLIKLKWLDLVYAVIILVPVVLMILFAPIFDFGGVFMQMVCVVYAIIISFMVGKSISNLIRNKSLLNLIVLIGSLLFMISDLMLLFNNFADLPRIFGIMCLATYYPAQIMLALSLNQNIMK